MHSGVGLETCNVSRLRGASAPGRGGEQGQISLGGNPIKRGNCLPYRNSNKNHSIENSSNRSKSSIDEAKARRSDTRCWGLAGRGEGGKKLREVSRKIRVHASHGTYVQLHLQSTRGFRRRYFALTVQLHFFRFWHGSILCLVRP